VCFFWCMRDCSIPLSRLSSVIHKCNISIFSSSTYMTASIKEKLLLYHVREKKDSEAFGALYDIYVEQIYRFVYYKLSNKEEAEDVTSEVFLKTWQYLTDAKSKPIDSFRALIYMIARNKIIDVYRKRSREQVCAIEYAEEIVGDTDIESEVGIRMEMDRLREVMATLKQDYQDVLHLRYIDELSLLEIATILDKSYASARVLLHRAMKKLKDCI
jgi:RNA polymerase sigma-70 factor, ECF subfamily